MTETDRLVDQLHDAGIGVSFTNEHRRCVDTLLDAFGPLRRWPTVADVTDSVATAGPAGLSILVGQELATFDDNRLTSLVVAAHQHRCRVAIRPWRPHLDEQRASRVRSTVAEMIELDDPADLEIETVHALDILVTARADTGPLFDYHPGVDVLVSADRDPERTFSGATGRRNR